MLELRVNISKDQNSADQGSVDLADFRICYAVLDADSRGVIHFSGKCLGAELY